MQFPPLDNHGSGRGSAWGGIASLRDYKVGVEGDVDGPDGDQEADIRRRRDLAYQWYTRLSFPSYDKFVATTKTQGMQITKADVDLLPWKASPTKDGKKKMSVDRAMYNKLKLGLVKSAPLVPCTIEVTKSCQVGENQEDVDPAEGCIPDLEDPVKDHEKERNNDDEEEEEYEYVTDSDSDCSYETVEEEEEGEEEEDDDEDGEEEDEDEYETDSDDEKEEEAKQEIEEEESGSEHESDDEDDDIVVFNSTIAVAESSQFEEEEDDDDSEDSDEDDGDDDVDDSDSTDGNASDTEEPEPVEVEQQEQGYCCDLEVNHSDHSPPSSVSNWTEASDVEVCDDDRSCDSSSNCSSMLDLLEDETTANGPGGKLTRHDSFDDLQAEAFEHARQLAEARRLAELERGRQAEEEQERARKAAEEAAAEAERVRREEEAARRAAEEERRRQREEELTKKRAAEELERKRREAEAEARRFAEEEAERARRQAELEKQERARKELEAKAALEAKRRAEALAKRRREEAELQKLQQKHDAAEQESRRKDAAARAERAEDSRKMYQGRTEEWRFLRVHRWYMRMAQPTMKDFKRRLAAVPHCDVQPDDADLLPWTAGGFRVNVIQAQKIILEYIEIEKSRGNAVP